MKPLKIGVTGVRGVVGETFTPELVVGFAQDMDADRLAVVNEKGEPVGEDYTLVLAALYALGLERGPVVAHHSTTGALAAAAERAGCPLYESKVGEGNVGVIYPRINFARDSLTGMALVLHLLAEGGQTVSEVIGSLPRFRMVKEKMPCPSHKIKDVLKMVLHTYAGHPTDTRDGVKVTVPGGWFLVRGSNTEPIVRVVAKAETEEAARRIVDAVFAQVRAVVVS